MTGTLSLRGLARLMGVSEKAVRKALLAGVFSAAAVSRDAHDTPIVLNATLAVDEWQKSGRHLRGSRPTPAARVEPDPPPATDPRAELDALLARARELRQRLSPGTAAAGDDELNEPDATPRDDPATSPTLVEAQIEAMLERGRKLRMENDLREGSLVEGDQAARAAFEFARSVREAVLNVPARVASELAAETDGARVFTRLEAALREALETTASMLEQSAPATAEG